MFLRAANSAVCSCIEHLIFLQEIDEGDQAILESFMPSGGTRNLADLIMEKIQAKEAGEEQVVEGRLWLSLFLRATAD